jgi:hypothetical protein
MGGRSIIKFTARKANQGRISKVGEPKIITMYQCTNGKGPQLMI